jgi:hypothetical protein
MDGPRAQATGNRNLGLLRSMLEKASKDGKIRSVPHFPMFSEKSLPIRHGLVDPHVFARLRDTLPENLRPLLTFLYLHRMKARSRKQITWEMVNSDCTEITLPKEIIKNRTPLTLPLVGVGLLKKIFRKDSSVFDATDATNLGWA